MAEQNILNDPQRETAELALQKSREELLQSLDEIQIDFPAFVGMERLDPKSRRETIFQLIKTEHKDRICSNQLVRELCINDDWARRVSLVCVIADIMGAHGSVTAAALLVVEGLHRLCSDVWKS
jgi:hypothetical protein